MLTATSHPGRPDVEHIETTKASTKGDDREPDPRQTPVRVSISHERSVSAGGANDARCGRGAAAPPARPVPAPCL